MNHSELFEQIKDIIGQENIFSLKTQALQIDKVIGDHRIINIAVLGEFNVGKSSFINSFIGRDILPVGVIPVTSVITSVTKGPVEQAMVCFTDGQRKETPIGKLNDFINESDNPGNIKQVESVEITLPHIDLPDGLRLIDTPGLGSFKKHNTLTTRQWFTHVGVAVIAISTGHPLGENELDMIRDIFDETPEIVVLLTKTDMFTEEEVTGVESYVRQSLKAVFGRDIGILRYSAKKDTTELNRNIVRNVIAPLNTAFDEKHNRILNHKLSSLARQCIAYLDIARITALHSEAEREKLKQEIFDRKLNRVFPAREMALVLSDRLNGIRDRLLDSLLPKKNTISDQLKTLFEKEYKTWNGNLYQRTRQFEQWMQRELNRTMIRLADDHEKECRKIVKEAGDHFIFFATSFRNGLNDKIKKVLGVEIPAVEPDITIGKIDSPDILVNWTFDSHIDLLWFLFPMSIFGKIFARYFKNCISRQVEINIYRLASTLTNILSVAIRSIMEQTGQYITDELETIETLLTNTTDKSTTYEKLIVRLQELMPSTADQHR